MVLSSGEAGGCVVILGASETLIGLFTTQWISTSRLAVADAITAARGFPGRRSGVISSTLASQLHAWFERLKQIIEE
jgi:hypothetical protein